MAQAPTVELPKRLPLVISPDNRGTSTSVDAKLVNCYSERAADGTYWIYKRPGTTRSSQPSGGAATGRGIFNWLGDIYSIFGATMYKASVALSGTLNTTNGVYKFDSCKGATPKMQFGDGVKAYNYDSSGGIVLINDADFPAAFVKGFAYLDATTYVGTATAAALQGSGLNDPTSWDILNIISAYIEPDAGVAVAKQLVYVVFFKQWSTEIFYDAANASGSPLAPVQGAKINMGCRDAGSVTEIDGILLWIAVNKSQSVTVAQMESLKAVTVSTDPIQRLLTAGDYTTVWSFGFKNGGHRFYVVTLKSSDLTLAYDLDEKMWWQITDTDGHYFPFVSATYSTSTGQLLQHETDGYIYTIADSVYTDNGSTIQVDIVTPNFDGETNRRKNMTMMKFVADQVTGSTLQVRKNDADYKSTEWSNFRNVDLGAQQPMLPDCGTFVRRAHNFRHKSATSLRLKAVEMQLDLGTL